MENLNNFNIIAGIQNFTALLKSKDILLPIEHLKAVKFVVAVILCVALDKEMKVSVPKNPPSLIMFRKQIIALFLFWPPQFST